MHSIKEISVFIDESGSIESDRQSSRYYLVCMVFHNQAADIADELDHLSAALVTLNIASDHCVHAGPLIRREKEYAFLDRQTRRGLFDRMMAFLRRMPISYKCFRIDKCFLGNNQSVHDPLLQRIVQFLLEHAAEFNAFDKLKVYYDNGQVELTRLLKESFAIFASRTEFVPEVEPSRYRLFQVADLICTLELARAKLATPEGLSESERAFFGGERNFKKNFLKILDRKLFR